jgi:DNA-directed RNA polymerase specialized sigma24 family protein
VEETGRLTTDASSRDPAVGLRSVRSLRLLAERLEELQITSARELGWSWQEIADQLGVSRQAVHQKYAGRRRLGRRD